MAPLSWPACGPVATQVWSVPHPPLPCCRHGHVGKLASDRRRRGAGLIRRTFEIMALLVGHSGQKKRERKGGEEDEDKEEEEEEEEEEEAKDQTG